MKIAQIVKGGKVEGGKLHYRFNPNSMSGRLTSQFVKDNERFYQLLKEHKIVPKSLEKVAFLKGYYILGAMNWKISKQLKAFWYLVKWSWVKIGC